MAVLLLLCVIMVAIIGSWLFLASLNFCSYFLILFLSDSQGTGPSMSSVTLDGAENTNSQQLLTDFDRALMRLQPQPEELVKDPHNYIRYVIMGPIHETFNFVLPPCLSSLETSSLSYCPLSC